MSTPQRAGSMQEAEKALLEFFERKAAGASTDFDELCAQRPELAEDLRFLNSAYAPRADAETISFREMLLKDLGGAGLLSLSLDGGTGSHRLEERSEADVFADGRFLAKSEIGRGGMSRILRAWDRDLGRSVAIKVTFGRAAGAAADRSGRDAAERLLSEAHITARLEHPGVVPVHDVGIARDGRAYFTMRLVKGESFRDVIDWARTSKNGWSVKKALVHLVKICQTIAFAHAKGVVHRDIKPSNVMVGPFGETYVMDWGLAKVNGVEDRHALRLGFSKRIPLSTVERHRSGKPSYDPEDPLVTPAGTIVGTPVYMSPEQAKGEIDRVNQASDVYALGAVLYTILTGRPPYVPADGKGSALEILNRVVEGPPPRVLELDPSAPRELVAICEKAMARRPEDRHRDALGLAADLESAIAGHALDSRAGATPRIPGRGLARRAAAILAIVGLVAIALVAGRARWSSPRGTTEILASLQGLSDLTAEAERIGPVHSTNADAMRRWLERARVFADGAGRLAASLGPVGGLRDGDDDASRLDEPADRLRRGLAALTAGDPFGGTIARVEREWKLALEMRKKTIDDAWQTWQDAVAAIADRSRCPGYAGLEIAPEEGFIPIGADPGSGLWELGFLPSGRIPERGSSGKLEVDAKTALVFVLIPGGAGRNAFLLSKFEMTRSQWRRLAGDETDSSGGSIGDEAVRPATSVSWNRAHSVLQRFGLELPTMAQWRSAASGGSFGIVDMDRGALEWCRDWEPLERGKAIAGRGSSPESSSTAPYSFDFAAPEFRGADVGIRPSKELLLPSK